MSNNTPAGWVVYDSNNPPPPGTVLRLQYVNKVVSNPITIQDGRGLAWGRHQYYSWSPNDRHAMGWRIAYYQIVKE